MPDELDLSRRKVLAALGTVGVASAGAGVGTSAFFSDQETFENNQLTAGTLDMKVGWEEHYSDWSEDEAEHAHMEDGELVIDDHEEFMNATLQEQFPDKQTKKELDQGTADPCDVLADVPDDLSRPLIELEDVKPGDFGEVTFSFALCDNPGYVWMNGGLLEAAESGITEPEADDPAEDGDPGSTDPADVELLDQIQVTVWCDSNYNNLFDEASDPAPTLDPFDEKQADIDGDGEDETIVPVDREVGFAEGKGVGEDVDVVFVGVREGTDYHDITIQNVDDDEDDDEVVVITDHTDDSADVDSDFDEGDDDDDVYWFSPKKSQGSLRDVLGDLDEGNGIPIDGTPITPDRGCFTPETRHCIGFKWELPVDHGNEVQSDSARFDLGFYTEQCRHNDGSGMNDEPVERPEPSITINDQPAGEPP
ncbi:MAG: SipW-dependent-type signal peptide-containing protein [Haloferacaceae archaeon]